jgi:hypothetical protein
MWNLVLVHLNTVLVSVKDKCTVCAKHTVGTEFFLLLKALKLFWTHPMVLLGVKAQVEARFSLIGDSAKLDAR